MAIHIDRNASADEDPPVSRGYAWVVFALTFGLMLSDYLSRQVINAIFPYLKAEWALTDSQLGSLVSVVALTVGIMTFPISLVADRWGRVKSATAMALVWGTATIACGFSGNFAAMFVARMVVGLGEAGYGSAGGAILASVFPRRMHSTVMGAFLAAALFGSVLGVVLGGLIARSLGWQMAFYIIGAGGLVLAVIYPLVVKEPGARKRADTPRIPLREVIPALFRTRTARLTFVASGLQMFIQGAVIAWAPSFLNRYYGMEPATAAVKAGLLILLAGVGMTFGGILIDRMSVQRQSNRLRLPALFALASGAILFVAFSLQPGTVQFALIGMGMLVASGCAGPSGAVVASLVSPAIHATVFATLTLSNNLFGLAPGPYLTGVLADAFGLDEALRVATLTCIVAAVVFYAASRSYGRDLAGVSGDEIDALTALENEEGIQLLQPRDEEPPNA